jgi:UDPglucose--hexose-1-phosphate uridylyltransferase
VYRTGGGAPDAPGWRIRVVPNLYPMVAPDAGHGATGAHEVVVLSADHDRSLGELDDDAVAELFTVLRERARHHEAAGRAFVQSLVNHGRAAGASIPHPHAQVVAIDLVPPAVQRALGGFAARGDQVAADLETADRHGLVVLDAESTAWCPHASSSPYQVRVAHPKAGSRFEDAPDEHVGAVARMVRDSLARLIAAVDDVPYNLVLHTAPRGRPGPFHWYVDVRPRLGVVAGFELGTGIDVNVVDPAVAAEQLRAAGP